MREHRQVIDLGFDRGLDLVRRHSVDDEPEDALLQRETRLPDVPFWHPKQPIEEKAAIVLDELTPPEKFCDSAPIKPSQKALELARLDMDLGASELVRPLLARLDAKPGIEQPGPKR